MPTAAAGGLVQKERVQGELALPHKIGAVCPIDLRSTVADFEHQHILDALRRSRGVVPMRPACSRSSGQR